MMTDQEFEDLKKLLRAERARCCANHWTYEYARHFALHQKYLKEKGRRDMQIATERVVITMTREELQALDRALADAVTYWERTCPDDDDDNPNMDAAGAFNELSMFWQRVTHHKEAAE